jgi:hypothetical protein
VDFRLAMKHVKESLGQGRYPNMEDIETLYNALTESRRLATFYLSSWLGCQTEKTPISFQVCLREVDDEIQKNLNETEREMSL